MSIEDIKKKLEEAGVNSEGWENTSGKTVRSPLIDKQRELLKNLEKLIVQQISADTDKVADLHVKLQMLKHGGGR